MDEMDVHIGPFRPLSLFSWVVLSSHNFVEAKADKRKWQ